MHRTLTALSVLVIAFTSASAHAFTTRVHITIANEVRDKLIASADGASIALEMGSHKVVLSAADARAIIEQPLAFRAGAIGPDNLVFPAMTDPSHAIHMRPFDQCQSLYDLAITDEERAYAMGCFLHGATDAIAHHYVNFFAGETFTMTPMSAGRAEAWDNVIRHIVTESMIQKAMLVARPKRFESYQLQHTLPRGFIQRAYLNVDSPLWHRISQDARAKFETARAANPAASLGQLVLAADLSPAEQLVLLPMYLSEIDQSVVELRARALAEIVSLQADADLAVTAGDDGQLGTSDDDTSCAASCPQKYATYFTYVALLAPRTDAGGNKLPSAFDVVTSKLRADLQAFIPVFIETVERISTKLNGPLSLDHKGLDLDATDLDFVFAPMRDWVERITAIDYQTLVEAVVPQWLLQLESLLDSVGVNVNIPSLVRVLFQPVIDEISATVEEHVVAKARTYLDELTAQYRAQVTAVTAEIEGRLAATTPAGLNGHALTHIFESGLWAHSFNIAAATLARHEVVLPSGDDWGGFGPATFDASYTPTWMQAGVCDYLRAPIFPLGTDLKALLSVRISGTDHAAAITENSPVECHDGSLTVFASTPSETKCELVSLDNLLTSPIGSLSRSFPPAAVDATVTCLNIEVPGLPKPPAGGDAGVGADAGNGGSGDGDSGGCGCGSTRNETGTWLLLALVLLPLVVTRRRMVVAALSVALCVGCGGTGGGTDSGVGVIDATQTDASGDALNTADAGTSPRARLLATLANTIWHSRQTRSGIERGYELEFRASSLLWAEIRNPYGPGRHREMRNFTPAADGTSVASTVIVPGGWPSNPDNGRQDDWTLEVLDESPRILRTTRAGIVEDFVEGPWPAPTEGLTAIVYNFPPGMGIDDAFCNSGTGGFDYPVLLAGARGTSGETLLGVDVVAGAPLMRWSGGNNFAVTDVHGFNRLGGTSLSSQSNFVVRYLGTMQHPGGTLAMREQDDSVEDGVWVFMGDDVGSDNTNRLFLEVHGFVWSDLTTDEPSKTFPAGPVPIETILYRCTEPVEPVDVQINTGSGWMLLGEAPSTPLINDELFPPAF